MACMRANNSGIILDFAPSTTIMDTMTSQPKKLSDAMREAIQLPKSELERLGHASREAVLRLHDTTAEVAKLEALIRRSVGPQV